MLLLGYTAQKGLLPLSLASIEEAIRLNGSFVEGNLRTFALGRLAACDPKALAAELDDRPELVALETVDDVLASRTRLLTNYQDAAYADRYRDWICNIRDRVSARKISGGENFVRAVALSLGRLMAYKDEYEVARLFTEPDFMRRMREQFSGDFEMTFHLAPPMLPGRDPSGRPRKRSFGPWILFAFKLLRNLKCLRGTAFDPFGYTTERRMERRLIDDYRKLIEDIADRVDERNLTAAIDLAHAASEIGGYGPVKEASVKQYRERLKTLMQTFEAPPLHNPKAHQVRH